jgi:hypothetical protein
MRIDEMPDLDDLQSRLRLDYQVVSQMYSPLMKVAAYRNVDDLRAERYPVTSITEGNLATHYRVTYNIRTLTGSGLYSPATTVHFDLLANTDYPRQQPSCYVIDSPLPWSPHFSDTGWICIGKIWEKSDGNMLLGELLVHIAKLLNFDEPEYVEADYGGFRPEAVSYWTKELGRQPLTRNLHYPMIPPLIPESEAEHAAVPPRRFLVKNRRVSAASPAPTHEPATPRRITLKRRAPVLINRPRIKIRPTVK